VAHPNRPPVRSGRPRRVGELVPEVLEEVGLGATSAVLRLLGEWDSALGEQFAPHCRLDGIRHGVVYARVRDSGWMQRIQLEKPKILARIAKALGESIACDLRFRLGDVEQDTSPSPGRGSPGR